MSADQPVTPSVAMPEDGRAGPVAEKDAGIALGPIGDGR